MNIKYFMWGFQHHFQYKLKEYASELFGTLSSTLQPTVFLVGILREESETDHPICMQPEECGVNLEMFKEVDNLAKDIHSNDPRKNIVNTLPNEDDKYHENLKTECMCKAVQQIIDKKFKPLGQISFVSRPVRVNKYEVYVVLQFDESIYNKFDHLNRNELIIHKYRKNKVYRSLIEATVDVFLYEAIQPLYKPNQNRWLYNLNIGIDEALRISGGGFIGTAVSAGSQSHATYDLFDICNYISSMKYEGDSNFGKMLIATDNHPNIKVIIELNEHMSLRPNRTLRKLLEISSEKLFLYTNGNEIIGFAEITGVYDSSKEDLFEVVFLGEQKWELRHNNKTLMLVQYSHPRLPMPKIDLPKLNSTLKRIFSDIEPKNVSDIMTTIISATEQKHGTLIIVSKVAETEAIRLKNQSTMIKPMTPDDELIQLITKIDGALLIDDKGICHSIGVILDGIANKNGSSSRGARYNSAIRYIDSQNNNAVAIIISEDGMVDVYPQLKPQIQKSEIEKQLSELKHQISLQVVDYDKYRLLMNWFQDHEFYLSKEVCEEITELKKIFRSKLIMEVGAIYIEYPDLKPDLKMNDSYFLKEK